MKNDLPASEAYDVSRKMLMDVVGCSRSTLWQYERLGMIPKARRRQGVKEHFYTEAQANKLLRLLGRKERIRIED